jgi:hypothetical protein
MSNRQAVIIMIQLAPPPRPACFESDDAWKGWLIGAHIAGLKIVRRSDLGKWSGNRVTQYRLLPTSQIPYCTDCRAVYRERMVGLGRCHPSEVKPERESALDETDQPTNPPKERSHG